jgi:hypothetical protein
VSRRAGAAKGLRSVAVQREPAAEERHQQWIRVHSRFFELECLDDNRSAIDERDEAVINRELDGQNA